MIAWLRNKALPLTFVGAMVFTALSLMQTDGWGVATIGILVMNSSLRIAAAKAAGRMRLVCAFQILKARYAALKSESIDVAAIVARGAEKLVEGSHEK